MPKNKLLKIVGQKNGTLKLFYASVILLAIAITLLIIALVVQSDTKRINSYSAQPAKAFSTGQMVEMGDVSLLVKKVSFGGSQPGFLAPPGKYYAVVDLLVKNRSEKPIDIEPSSDSYVKDSAGNVSYLTPYILDNPFRAGELPPGEQISGQLSYIAPKNQPLKLYIDGIWSGGVIPFALN